MAITYAVQPGDTLFLIARRFGTTVANLVQANNIADPNQLYPGQVLTIPGGVAPTPLPTVTPVPTCAPTPVPTISPYPTANVLSNPDFEDWPDPALPPTGWTGRNLSRSTLSYTGNFAAELGATPNQRAVLSQLVNIESGNIYDLNFWAREDIQPGNVARYILFVEVYYFDSNGNFVGRTEPTFSQDDIPDNAYQQYSLSTGRVPARAGTAEVRFSFEPSAANTNSVKIDDVGFIKRF